MEEHRSTQEEVQANDDARIKKNLFEKCRIVSPKHPVLQHKRNKGKAEDRNTLQIFLE